MGHKRGLSREDVVDAAAELADKEGLQAATLAAVAAKLGVRSPSLYHHVASWDDLRRLLALRHAQQLSTVLAPALAQPSPIEALRQAGRAFRALVQRHPGLYAASFPAPRPGEDDVLSAALAHAVALLSVPLAQLGLSTVDTVQVIRAFRSFLHGFVVLERDGGFGLPHEVEPAFERGLELLLGTLSAESRKKEVISDPVFEEKLRSASGRRGPSRTG